MDSFRILFFTTLDAGRTLRAITVSDPCNFSSRLKTNCSLRFCQRCHKHIFANRSVYVLSSARRRSSWRRSTDLQYLSPGHHGDFWGCSVECHTASQCKLQERGGADQYGLWAELRQSECRGHLGCDAPSDGGRTNEYVTGTGGHVLELAVRWKRRSFPTSQPTFGSA